MMIYSNASGGAPVRERLRNLGRIESVMALSHGTLHGTGQIVLVMELACGADLDLELLNSAAAAVRRRFALLRCAIEDNGAELYFSQADDSAGVVGLRAPTNDFTAFARQAIDEPTLDARRALWRVVVAPTDKTGQHYLALVLHHAIVDASGAGLITAALLTALDALLRGEAPPDLHSEVVPPALDDFLMMAQAAEEGPAAAAGVPESQSVVWTPISERLTGFQTLELEASIHAGFLRTCRTHGVTDNALLTSLYVRACVTQGAAAAPVAVRSAVSIRDVLSTVVEAEALGCYIGVNTTMLDIGTGTVVELARHYQRDLTCSILASSLRKRAFTVTALRSAMATAEGIEAFQRGVGITNVGHVDPATGLQRIRLCRYLPLARRVSNANACVLHVHSLDERLALTLVYPEPNFSQTRATAILADIGQAVMALAEDDVTAVKVAA